MLFYFLSIAVAVVLILVHAWICVHSPVREDRLQVTWSDVFERHFFAAMMAVCPIVNCFVGLIMGLSIIIRLARRYKVLHKSLDLTQIQLETQELAQQQIEHSC
jgi:hypothetical protein